LIAKSLLDLHASRRDSAVMRQISALLCALLLLPFLAAAGPAIADPYIDNAAVDELFEQLRLADNEIEANDISRQIWGYWFSPSDGKLATRMAVANNFLGEGDVEGSLHELDGVVAEYPDYAEGWNQRATVNYMLNRLDASLADIDKVLAIEPRHFGALSGRVLIYLKQGKHAEALRDMIAALAIHPYLTERRFFPELAQDVTHV
jgi:tetratricopeptide (TPR) repeat protein